MSGRTFIRVAVVTAVAIVGAASVASAQEAGQEEGAVQACSLAGINPAEHPGIFGNPQVARERFGFVKTADGKWEVIPNCEQVLNIRR